MTDRKTVPFHLALPRQSCELIDLASVESYGKNLVELADEDPIEAYRFLRCAMFATFSVKPDTKVVYMSEGGSIISSEQDGEAAILAAHKKLGEDVGSIIIQPVDVVLSALKTESDEGGPILSFIVNPPDYAF